MEIIVSEEKGFHLFRVRENLTLDSNLADLKVKVREYLADGAKNIALSFTPQSRLSSMAIGALLTLQSAITEHGGRMAIVQSSEMDMELLETLSFTCVIDMFKNENELLDTWP